MKLKNLSFLRNACKPEWVFLIITLLVGSCFAILVPAGGGADEPNHIARVESLARGNIIADRISDRMGYTSPLDKEKKDACLYGGVVDSAFMDVARSNMYSFHAPKNEGGQTIYNFPTWNTPEVISDAIIGESEQVEAFSNTAVNSPIVYIPYIIGYYIGKLFTNNAYAIILVMRMFGLLCYSIIVFLCIRFIPIGKWIIATVALIPAVYVSLSCVTADTMTFAMCIAFIAVVLRCSILNRELARKEWILLSLITVGMALVKLSYLPMLMLLALIPLVNTSMRKRSMMLRGIALACASCIVFLGWYLVISHINTGAMFNVGASPTFQKEVIFNDPFQFIKLLFKQFAEQNYFNLGVFGTLDAHTHNGYSGWCGILAICISLLIRDEREMQIGVTTRHRIYAIFLFLMTFIVVFVLIETALYLQFSAVGANSIAGVQARYFLPVLPILLLPLIFGKSYSTPHKEDNVAVGMMCIVQIMSAMFTLYVLYTTLFTS